METFTVYRWFLCLFLASLAFAADFRQESLEEHNRFRAKHGVPKLVLDATLNKYAQDYANYLAKKDVMVHSNGPYGENLYWSVGRPVQGKIAVESWYNEIKYYDYNNPGFGMKTGHFTQVVWKNSKKLGVGYAKSASGRTYVVASYNPPGNVSGRFPENVPRPKK